MPVFKMCELTKVDLTKLLLTARCDLYLPGFPAAGLHSSWCTAMQNRTERHSANSRHYPTLKHTSFRGDSPPLCLPFPGTRHSKDGSAGAHRRDGHTQSYGQRSGSSTNALHPLFAPPQCWLDTSCMASGRDETSNFKLAPSLSKDCRCLLLVLDHLLWDTQCPTELILMFLHLLFNTHVRLQEKIINWLGVPLNSSFNTIQEVFLSQKLC